MHFWFTAIRSKLAFRGVKLCPHPVHPIRAPKGNSPGQVSQLCISPCGFLFSLAILVLLLFLFRPEALRSPKLETQTWIYMRSPDSSNLWCENGNHRWSSFVVPSSINASQHLEWISLMRLHALSRPPLHNFRLKYRMAWSGPGPSGV